MRLKQHGQVLAKYLTGRDNLPLSMTSFLGPAHGPTAHCRTLRRPRQDSWTRGKSMSSLNHAESLEAVLISVVLSLSDWGNEKGGPPRIVQAMTAMTCEWYTRYTRLILLFFSQRHVDTYPQLICKWTSPSLAMGQDRTPQNEKTWETIILDQVSITIHPGYTCSFNFIYMCLTIHNYPHLCMYPSSLLSIQWNSAKVGLQWPWRQGIGRPRAAMERVPWVYKLWE